jgi:AraC family transcriptional regulator
LSSQNQPVELYNMQSPATIIDHRHRVKRVMMHINQHLEQKCRLDELAEVACFSPFHFIRVFETIMGETPQEYTVRKKMERAGFHLLKQDMRITDIALDVGYDTSSSFCKAFKAHFGMPPRRFQDTISKNWYYWANRTIHPLKGTRKRCRSGCPMPVIKFLPSLIVVCLENQGFVDGSYLKTASLSFKQLVKWLKDIGLERIVQAFVSIYPYRTSSLEDAEALNYVGAVLSQKIEPLENLRYFVLPPGRYAIFQHYGPYEYIMQTWNQIYANWLPISGRSLRFAPPIEVHIDIESTVDNHQLNAYIFIPIN